MIYDLPPELYPNIIKYLDWKDLRILTELSKRFAAFIDIAKKILPLRANADVPLEHFKHFAGMWYLDLIKIDNLSGEWLKILADVKILKMKDITITANSLDAIKNAEDVEFADCEFAGSTLPLFTKIKRLIIYNSDLPLRGLNHLTELRELEVGYTRETDLFHLKKLVKLKLGNASGIRNFDFLKEMRDLRELSISYSENLADDMFKHLGGLRWLDLEECDKITSAAFQYMAELEVIEIYSCKQMKEDFLKYIGQRVQRISLGNMKISASGFNMMRKVRELGLYCCEINMRDLLVLDELDFLYLKLCGEDEGYPILRDMKSLRYLVLSEDCLNTPREKIISDIEPWGILVHFEKPIYQSI